MSGAEGRAPVKPGTRPAFDKRISTFGGHRARRLRPEPAGLIAGLLPKLSIALPEAGLVDPHRFFPDKKSVWLEIGFGSGVHLAHLAQAHADVGFIGCEPFLNGVAALLKLVGQQELGNIRILQDDARKLLEALAPNTLERVYIFHPDPWPKSRHHKRRLISDAFLPLLHSRMVKGGSVKIATDWQHYADWILEHFLRSKQFRWTAQKSADWTRRFPESCATRYEEKARREGRATVYFEFIAL